MSVFCDSFQSNVQHICQWSNVGRKFLKFQFDNLAVVKFTADGQVVPMLGGPANGVLVQYEDLKMCAYNM